MKLTDIELAPADNVYVGGTYVLKHIVDLLDRDINDIDVIVHQPTKAQLFQLRNLESLGINVYKEAAKANSTYTPTVEGFGCILMNFYYNNINYYVVDWPLISTASIATIDHYKLVPLSYILHMKGYYNRPKDMEDLIQMSEKLTEHYKKHQRKIKDV
jgi:hypothetical protein